MPSSGVGWQPSRFLADRTEAEHAFQLAEQLGSVNAAAAELGTTWPSLRKAFTRHGLGMPARNPDAVRQRAIDAARQRTGRPATPTLDPAFVALITAVSKWCDDVVGSRPWARRTLDHCRARRRRRCANGPFRRCWAA
jgi:hypothetical protein